MGLPHLASSHPGSPSRAVSYCSWPADAFVAMFVPTYCSSAAGGQVLYAIRTVVTRHACWGSAFWNLGAPMQEGCSWADATVVSMSIGCPFTCGISGCCLRPSSFTDSAIPWKDSAAASWSSSQLWGSAGSWSQALTSDRKEDEPFHSKPCDPKASSDETPLTISFLDSSRYFGSSQNRSV